eukprot:TRINITY_DN5479_c0_g4_i1.p1 TRINITY_DN5479_c0_g4~~TRINITY_DN5479_c0_g4_i1.p1  ORF type:complete len:825 (+),score=179.36 TRINITY_DN5479_c0_g4_i1:31-2505(+)
MSLTNDEKCQCTVCPVHSEKNPVAGQWHVVLQLGVSFYAAFLWFGEGMLGTWNDIITYKYPVLYPMLEKSKVFPVEDVGFDRRPAIMAVSGCHTLLVLLGLVVGNTLKQRRFVVGFISGWVTTGILAFAFYHALLDGFSTNAVGIATYAKAMYWPTHIPEAATIFAAVGSFTMATWFGLSMAFAAFDNSDEGLASAVAARYLSRITCFYILTFVFFQFGCVPLWNSIVKYSRLGGMDFNINDVEFHAEEMSALTQLASATHTLTMSLGIVVCSVTNSIISRMPCAPNGGQSRSVGINNLVVLSALSLGFVIVFAQWVAFSLSHQVAHVVNFAETFLGGDAVANAQTATWSEVHTLVLFSYTTWFAGGIIFEQMWSGSATNERASSLTSQQPIPTISVWVYAVIIIGVAVPMAWTAGLVGLIVLVVLLWPMKKLPKSESFKWNEAPRGALPPNAREKQWEEATSDCPKTGQRYLVIGVGFVGVRLVKKLLERGETNIRCMDVSPVNPFQNNRQVEYFRGDVTKMDDLREAMTDIDTVYATFAVIRFYERWSFQERLSVRINIEGTRNVIAACKEMKVKNLVQTSTSHVMDGIQNKNGKPLSEDGPTVKKEGSHNHYSWTKAIAEDDVRKAGKEGGSLKTVSVRPCSGVFGHNDKTNIERFVNTRFLVMTFALDRMDWVHVDNVVLGHLKAEARLNDNTPGVNGEAFNVSNDQVLSYSELHEGFHYYYNKSGYYSIMSPDRFLWVLAYILYYIVGLTRGRITFQKIGLDVVSPPGLTTASLNFSADCKKATRVLNYRPAHNIRDAVQFAADDYRADLQDGSKQKME